MRGGSVSVFRWDLCVRWSCDACVRILLAGIASYFRVSHGSVAAESAVVVVTCPTLIHRIKNRAVRVRFVPRAEDFLKEATLSVGILRPKSVESRPVDEDGRARKMLIMDIQRW